MVKIYTTVGYGFHVEPDSEDSEKLDFHKEATHAIWYSTEFKSKLDDKYEKYNDTEFSTLLKDDICTIYDYSTYGDSNCNFICIRSTLMDDDDPNSLIYRLIQEGKTPIDLENKELFPIDLNWKENLRKYCIKTGIQFKEPQWNVCRFVI